MKPNDTRDNYEFDEDHGSISEDDDLAARDDVLEMARIEDFRHQAGQEEHTLAACLGGFMGGMMEITKHIERDTRDLLANRKGPLYDIPEFPRVMQPYLNLSRQLDRYANLYVRLTETKDTNSPFSRRRPGGKRSPNGGFGG